MPGAKTFFWSGEYDFDLNVAKTRETQLNVFADFHPTLSEAQRKTDVLFLANIHPELQMDVLHQCGRPRLVALDTMNLWIDTKHDALAHAFSQVDLVIINEAEARQFTREANVVKAARIILASGPRTIVLKRGEYGALMVTRDAVFEKMARRTALRLAIR